MGKVKLLNTKKAKKIALKDLKKEYGILITKEDIKNLTYATNI